MRRRLAFCFSALLCGGIGSAFGQTGEPAIFLSDPLGSAIYAKPLADGAGAPRLMSGNVPLINEEPFDCRPKGSATYRGNGPELTYISDIAADDNGFVYVLNGEYDPQEIIRVHSGSGDRELVATLPGEMFYEYLEIASDGTFFVAGPGNRVDPETSETILTARVDKVTPTGDPAAPTVESLGTVDHSKSLADITLDSDGNVFLNMYPSRGEENYVRTSVTGFEPIFSDPIEIGEFSGSIYKSYGSLPARFYNKNLIIPKNVINNSALLEIEFRPHRHIVDRYFIALVLISPDGTEYKFNVDSFIRSDDSSDGFNYSYFAVLDTSEIEYVPPATDWQVGFYLDAGLSLETALKDVGIIPRPAPRSLFAEFTADGNAVLLSPTIGELSMVTPEGDLTSATITSSDPDLVEAIVRASDFDLDRETDTAYLAVNENMQVFKIDLATAQAQPWLSRRPTIQGGELLPCDGTRVLRTALGVLDLSGLTDDPGGWQVD